MCACVHVCVRACMRACVHVCVCMPTSVNANIELALVGCMFRGRAGAVIEVACKRVF